jgi:hypothetical protein
MDPGRAPQRVFLAYPLDEITQATIDLRPLAARPAMQPGMAFCVRRMGLPNG